MKVRVPTARVEQLTDAEVEALMTDEELKDVPVGVAEWLVHHYAKKHQTEEMTERGDRVGMLVMMPSPKTGPMWTVVAMVIGEMEVPEGAVVASAVTGN